MCKRQNKERRCKKQEDKVKRQTVHVRNMTKETCNQKPEKTSNTFGYVYMEEHLECFQKVHSN